MNDPIVEEIHAIREKIAEECGYDMEIIGQYFMEWQIKHPELLVREVPKAEKPKIAPK
jgi:hypothetical protein